MGGWWAGRRRACSLASGCVRGWGGGGWAEGRALSTSLCWGCVGGGGSWRSGWRIRSGSSYGKYWDRVAGIRVAAWSCVGVGGWEEGDGGGLGGWELCFSELFCQ